MSHNNSPSLLHRFFEFLVRIRLAKPDLGIYIDLNTAKPHVTVRTYHTIGPFRFTCATPESAPVTQPLCIVLMAYPQKTDIGVMCERTGISLTEDRAAELIHQLCDQLDSNIDTQIFNILNKKES